MGRTAAGAIRVCAQGTPLSTLSPAPAEPSGAPGSKQTLDAVTLEHAGDLGPEEATGSAGLLSSSVRAGNGALQSTAGAAGSDSNGGGRGGPWVLPGSVGEAERLSGEWSGT